MPGVIVRRIVRMVVENEELRRFRNTGIERVRVECAKACRKIAVLDGREFLILEEDDLVREQSAADIEDLLVVQLLRKIDVADDGTDPRRQSCDGDPGHCLPVLWCHEGQLETAAGSEGRGPVTPTAEFMLWLRMRIFQEPHDAPAPIACALASAAPKSVIV